VRLPGDIAIGHASVPGEGTTPMVDAAIAVPARRVDTATEDRLFRHVIWRLVPLLVLLYLVAYIDRQNVSYAKLQMLSGARGRGHRRHRLPGQSRRLLRTERHAMGSAHHR